MLNSSSISSLGQRKSAANDKLLQNGLRVRWTKKDQFTVENLYVFEVTTA